MPEYSQPCEDRLPRTEEVARSIHHLDEALDALISTVERCEGGPKAQKDVREPKPVLPSLDAPAAVFTVAPGVLSTYANTIHDLNMRLREMFL